MFGRLLGWYTIYTFGREAITLGIGPCSSLEKFLNDGRLIDSDKKELKTMIKQGKISH